MLNAEKEILKPWCVAIIDDSPEDRTEIRRMLLMGSDRRLTFLEAGTAQAGINAVLGAAQPPDCIVLDYNLPDMDAPEVLAALAGPGAMPICPVLVITGGTNREHGRRALRAGAQDYFGKDWTNPHALIRAVENTCEIWAMALELRQRESAMRLGIQRESFRTDFRSATRDLRDENVVKHVALHLLGKYLMVNRAVYGEVALDQSTVVIGQSYVNGVRQIEGSYRWSDYDPQLPTALMAGENKVVCDARIDYAYSPNEKVAHAALDVVASLSIPILKNGSLVAILSVHQNTPREWTLEDIRITQEIAELTWVAVEHARTAMSLLAKEMQLSQMMVIMPSFSAVLVGPKLVFQMANQAYFDIVGRGPEIIGKTVSEVFPELADQAFPALLEEVYRTGHTYEAKSMLARLKREPSADLVDIFVDFAYLPLRGPDGHVSGIFMHGVDRSAEVRATQALALRERELCSLTENIPDGLTRFDQQFHFTFVNSVFAKIAGRSITDIVGKSLHDLDMPTPLCSEWDLALHRVFEHQVARAFEFTLSVTEGLQHFSFLLVPEFGGDGQVVSVLGVIHDITDRRAYEQRLIGQDLRKNEFLAVLAHELRNPLAPLHAGVQLLKLTSNTQGTAQRTLAMMERQLGHLVRMMDDLIDLSRINSGKFVLKRERIALQDVASAAMEISRSWIEEAKHTLTVDWPEQLIWLHADPTRLAQIFSNLLINSAKYMRTGGAIKFSIRMDGERVRISVLDTGLGIEAHMLDSVFNRFTQINTTLDRAQDGLGIGLSLVKTLVEMHDGTVQARSAGADKGSEFSVCLPVEVVGEIHIAELQVLVAPFVGLRILILDDNVDAAESMAELMTLSGHEAQAVFSSEEGLELAATFHPDVLFLDIGLPRINGYEVARRLLAHPSTAAIKLIALTGWGTPEDIRQTEMTGFQAHLTKPAHLDSIQTVLAKLFQAV